MTTANQVKTAIQGSTCQWTIIQIINFTDWKTVRVRMGFGIENDKLIFINKIYFQIPYTERVQSARVL